MLVRCRDLVVNMTQVVWMEMVDCVRIDPQAQWYEIQFHSQRGYKMFVFRESEDRDRAFERVVEGIRVDNVYLEITEGV